MELMPKTNVPSGGDTKPRAVLHQLGMVESRLEQLEVRLGDLALRLIPVVHEAPTAQEPRNFDKKLMPPGEFSPVAERLDWLEARLQKLVVGVTALTERLQL